MLLSVALVIATYFLSFGAIHGETDLQLRSYGVKDTTGDYLSTVNSYWLHLPLALSALLTSWSIGLYRDRRRQIFLLRITFFLFAITFILLSLYVSDAQRVYPQAKLSIGPAFVFPPFALVLNWLSARMIRRDEELVRSVDRIR